MPPILVQRVVAPLALVVAASIFVTAGTAQQDKLDVLGTVKGRELMYVDAVRRQESALLVQVFSDDFVATDNGGAVYNRAQELARIKGAPGYTVVDLRLEHQAFREPDERTVVTTGRARLASAEHGRIALEVFDYVRTYVATGYKVRCVSQRITAVPNSASVPPTPPFRFAPAREPLWLWPA